LKKIKIGDGETKVHELSFAAEEMTGCKGYYIIAIDPSKKYIYLSTTGEECVPVWPDKLPDGVDNIEQYHNKDFNLNYTIYDLNDDVPDYANELSITAEHYFHWIFAANIVEIVGNRIKYSDKNILSEYPDKNKAAYKKWWGISGSEVMPMKFYVAYQSKIGNVTFGLTSHSEGFETFALDDHSHAEGCDGLAVGFCSHVEGQGNRAGYCAHAEGAITLASGLCAHAEGESTTASGDFSHAQGYNTKATAECAHAEGGDSEAVGKWSHAEGGGTYASGAHAHTEGSYTTASGNQSHAGGRHAQAKG
jgi:hypothetical protein